MLLKRTIRFAALLFFLGVVGPLCPAQAEDKAPKAKTPIEVSQSFRASSLMGLAVKNPSGENVGHVEDLLLNVSSGHVSHAILSFGGVLGFGEKLFPVPWREVTIRHDGQATYLVVNVSKAFLEKAPNFERNTWPDMTPEWITMIETFFPTHAGLFVEATGDRLTMTYMNDKGEHSHAVATNATVTRNGRPATLKDLRAGDTLHVTTEEQAGIHVVTKIDAQGR